MTTEEELQLAIDGCEIFKRALLNTIDQRDNAVRHAAALADELARVRAALIAARPWISESAGAGNEHAPRVLRQIDDALKDRT